MKETAHKTGSRDRKLGDEWADWDGRSRAHDQEIEERSATFLILAAVAVCMLVGLLIISWYMVRPRIEQFYVLLPKAIEWALAIGGALLFVLVCIEILVLRRMEKSLFPYKLVERLFLMVLPKALWVGARMGINRDRVGNSFIKVHNYITATPAHRLNPQRLLVLLPRCLGRQTRGEIMSRAEEYEVQIVTAGGGEEARKAIGEFRPTLILAVACERDLLSGIKDVTERVPVLAIPNKRPEGPCKNTCLQIEKFDYLLHFVKAPRKKTDQILSS
ncbi:MAG TPA: DUF116 domain-containing protein [Syntrophorhabdaceae bacterium]